MPRKSRSDKGIKRKDTNITSKSSDKDIKKFIQRINNKINSYYNASNLRADTEVVAENFVTRVQNLLTFETTKFTNKLELVEKDGKYYIPKTKESVDWFKDTLGRQERAREEQTNKDETYKPGRTLAQQLDELRTFNETIKKTQEDLNDPDKASYSNAVLLEPNKNATKEEKATIKEINRREAVKEIIARAEHVYTESISDTIDKLYEDQVKNADLIEKLGASEKWTGELLEEVNLRAEGIVIEDIF